MRFLSNDEIHEVVMNMCKHYGYDMSDIVLNSVGVTYVNSLLEMCKLIVLDDNDEICNIQELSFVKAPDIIKK